MHRPSLRELAGPTDLAIASVLNGETLFRFGNGIYSYDSRAVTKTAAQSSNSTSFADVTDLGFANVKAHSIYGFRFLLRYTSAGATTALGLNVSFDGTVTSIMVGATMSTAAAATFCATATATGTDFGSTTNGPNTVNVLAQVDGLLRVGASPGTLQLRFRRNNVSAGSGVTIQADSYGALWEIL